MVVKEEIRQIVVKDESWYVQVMLKVFAQAEFQTGADFTCSKVLCVSARGYIHNVVEDVDVVFAVTHQGR